MDCSAEISIKNTFLEVTIYETDDEVDSSRRRSPSAPPSWRPGKCVDGALSDGSDTTAPLARSPCSTKASPAIAEPEPPDLWPDTDSDDEKFTGQFGHGADAAAAAALAFAPLVAWQPPLPLAEQEAVSQRPSVRLSGGTPLNREAAVFMPAACRPPAAEPRPPAEPPRTTEPHQQQRAAARPPAIERPPPPPEQPVLEGGWRCGEPPASPASAPARREFDVVLEAVRSAFLALSDAADLQVRDDAREGILARASFSRKPTADRCRRALDVLKKSLLDAALHSKGTYVLGYGTDPFKDEGWGLTSSFSATLSFLPPCRANSACWDAFEKGFCPRRSQCRWRHPEDGETCRLRLSLSVAEHGERSARPRRPELPDK